MGESVSQANSTTYEITTEKRAAIPEIAMSHNVTNVRSMMKTRKTVTFSGPVLMQLAISEGDVQEMSRLVARFGECIIDEREPSGLFPAMRAVFEDQLQSLQFLIDAGAHVTAQDEEGWTILHVAAAMDNEEAARIVLDNSKAKLTGLRDVEGRRPIDLAESVEMAALLLDAELFSRTDPDELALTEVVQRSYEYVHCEDGTVVGDVMSANPACETLLHLAMEKNYLLLLQHLLENKLVDPDTKDRDGRTPLHLAASRANTEAVLLLVMYGASVVAVDCKHKRACDLTDHGTILTILHERSSMMSASDNMLGV